LVWLNATGNMTHWIDRHEKNTREAQ
jgi:hypothetical protein